MDTPKEPQNENNTTDTKQKDRSNEGPRNRPEVIADLNQKLAPIEAERKSIEAEFNQVLNKINQLEVVELHKPNITEEEKQRVRQSVQELRSQRDSLREGVKETYKKSAPLYKARNDERYSGMEGYGPDGWHLKGSVSTSRDEQGRGEDMTRLNLYQERRAYQDQLQAEQEQNASEAPEPEKMGLIFFVSALFLSVIGDLIDFFTGGTIGWLIGLFIDAILALMFGMSKSGRKQFKRMAVALLAESIPIIDMLPFRTIFCIWSFISSRSKIARKVASVAHLTKKVV